MDTLTDKVRRDLMPAKMSRLPQCAFTLIELLAVVVVIALLAAIALPVYSHFTQQGAEIRTLSNMRQMGAAMLLYAGDNNSQLPGRVLSNKWPTLLKPYVQNLTIYTSPIPDVRGKSYKVSDQTKYFDDDTNYTSYIYNGFNDMGAYGDPTFTPRLNLMSRPTATILLGIPYPQTGQFYMDFSEGNEKDILNPQAFPTRSQYVFCDGSARSLVYNAMLARMKVEPTNAGGVYCDWYWLMNKNVPTP